ncbi:MAG: filamentous hemagglutinin N-terminal domain-containing protein, partial [Deltaproteobacteria bacterium]|nr:filamentous hemagglutinin N-terminal domain-containing protein [Deltaproteobacteria bacterium]
MKAFHIRHRKRINRIKWFCRELVVMFALYIFCANMAFANPYGPQVVSGSVQFNPQGNTLNITNSPNAVINWQGFSIGTDEITRFLQQSPSSAVLNRVIGQDPSAILGVLQSNGRVFLINPNGVLFGQGARIEVNGLAASTLNISDTDFLSGRYNFTAGAAAGGIQNQGSIVTPAGGRVYLIAPDIENTGIIHSPGGEVLLAAGHSVQLVDSVNPDMAVVISAPENKAVNLGQIIAESGKVGIYGGLIQHSGMVKADSAVAGENGRIFFKATKGVTLDKDSVTSAKGIRGGDINIQSEAGDTRVSGTVTATGSADQGGQINILGASVALTDNASLDASGATGGGTVLVGGDFLGRNPDIQNAETTYVGDSVTIKADALDQGTGGNVAVWANESTTFNGAISARGGTAGGDGGRVETSGHKLSIGSLATVNTLAPAGKTGSWLLDPTHDYFIAAVGGDITGAALSADLNTTDVEIWSEDGDTAGTGNIYVNDPVSWGLGTKLTLTAESDVFVNAKIENTNSSAGGVYFNTSDPSNVSFGNNGKVVIHNIEQLQWMNTALSGRYELGGNIDAADTINWNDAMGFEPVGESSDYPFRGFFDGMDHTISDLFINRPASDHIGLFGYTNDATIQNVGLTNVNVTGGNQVGGLVGMQAADAPNAAVINNSYATGLVTGTTYVGGLVGKSNGGSISESYATVDVTGDDSVGGLVGLNHGAGPIICIIESSYATGDVSGNTNIGGLVGENHGDIGGSHSSGGVQGDMRVGGLVGKNFGTISESYASGNVQGNADIGGLVGHNIYTNFDYPGRIANSYATGAVTGTNTTGGLVGYNYGYIENTYATGLVNNGVGGADIGGLVGQDDSYGGGDTTNSFWDDTTTGQVSSAVGTAKTTAELMTASTYTDAIWDFNTIWWMSEGNTRPFLRSEYSTKIVNAHQLQLIALDLAANYTLGKDIDMGELQNPSGLWKTTTGFFPLGDFEGIPSTYFSGTFDGNNHIIDGLYINRPAKQYVGLFGNAAGPSVIQNVGLTNVDITGGFQTGGLAAHLGADAGGDPYGTISNCFTTGTVTGTSTNVGGLVGLSAGYISNSYSIAEVSGLSNVGGLLGTNLYAFSSVTNCYSTGVVIGDGGGLVGLNFGGGPISNSFWDTQTSGRPTSAGGTGKTTVEMMTKSTFTDAGWNFANIWTIDEGVSYPCLFGPGCNPAALYWLLFTADNKIKTYGDANDFTSTITAPDGYAPGDDAGNITYEGEPAYSLFSENVGEWEILVTQGTLTSTKYDHFDFAPGLMTISKADLTLTAQTYTKIYDGTRSAAAIPAIAGLKFADTVTGARESYADKYAGTNKVLSVTGYTINDGNGGNNYHVTLVDNTTGVITARPITAAGITANDKVYDGNVNATLNLAGAELFGVIGHDAVTIDKSVATGLFDNKNVGIDKTVTVTGLGISGADTANYLLDPSYLTTANITPKAIIISGITANDKVYDGNVNATLNVAGAGFFGIIGGDAVNIDTASATGLFDNKNVGNGKNVQITGLGLNGQDAANYTVNTEAQTTANITALGITGSITAADKVYDGNTDAAILTR